MKRKMQKILARLKLKEVSAAFDGWSFAVRETKRMRHLATKGMAKLLNRELSAGFTAWQLWTKTIKRLRLSATRCVARITKSKESVAFTTWRINAGRARGNKCAPCLLPVPAVAT